MGQWARSCDSRGNVISKAQTTFGLIIDDVGKDDVALSIIITDLEKFGKLRKIPPETNFALSQMTPDNVSGIPRKVLKYGVYFIL